jgi:hypothetical protein
VVNSFAGGIRTHHSERGSLLAYGILRVGKGVKATEGRFADLNDNGNEWDRRIALIQALIPLGSEAAVELLHQEVEALVGPRYARGQRAPGLHRWTRQASSIYLADQKLCIERPRIRNRRTGQESLQTYAQLQQPTNLAPRTKACYAGFCTG